MTKKRTFNLTLIVLLILLFWLRGYIYIVRGNSMASEYPENSIVFLTRVNEVERYDVVVAATSKPGLRATVIKRVIGLPGDVVSIRNGYVMINGKYLLSDTFHGKIIFAGIVSSDLQLGEDEYFLMGDNRNNSEDSRNSWLGPVKVSQIIGRVL